MVAGFAAVLAGGIMLAGCGDDKKDESSSATTEATSTGKGKQTGLTTKDFEFSPKTLTATSGDAITITLKNEGQAEHNFSIDTLSVNQDVEPGQTQTVTFTPGATGNIEFVCKYHKGRGMTGTLTVNQP